MGWRRILQEDVVVIMICPLDQGDHMLMQKVLGIGSFTDANKNNRTLLAITAYHLQGHLLRVALEKGVHISHRKVCQVADAVLVDNHVPSEDFVVRKKSRLDEASRPPVC
jgi:hypothetical protein